MQKQHRLEANLKRRMLTKVGGCSGRGPCAMCGRWGWVALHHIKPRSLGGDPLDENNVCLLCFSCHQKEKDPRTRHRDKKDFKFSGPV